MSMIGLCIFRIYFDGFGLITICSVVVILLAYWADLWFQEIKNRRSERKKKKNETD